MKRCELCGTTSTDVGPSVLEVSDGVGFTFRKADRCRDRIACDERRARAARQPVERPS